jgi:hypothetical protein
MASRKALLDAIVRLDSASASNEEEEQQVQQKKAVKEKKKGKGNDQLALTPSPMIPTLTHTVADAEKLSAPINVIINNTVKQCIGVLRDLDRAKAASAGFLKATENGKIPKFLNSDLKVTLPKEFDLSPEDRKIYLDGLTILNQQIIEKIKIKRDEHVKHLESLVTPDLLRQLLIANIEEAEKINPELGNVVKIFTAGQILDRFMDSLTIAKYLYLADKIKATKDLEDKKAKEEELEKKLRDEDPVVLVGKVVDKAVDDKLEKASKAPKAKTPNNTPKGNGPKGILKDSPSPQNSPRGAQKSVKFAPNVKNDNSNKNKAKNKKRNARKKMAQQEQKNAQQSQSQRRDTAANRK